MNLVGFIFRRLVKLAVKDMKFNGCCHEILVNKCDIKFLLVHSGENFGASRFLHRLLSYRLPTVEGLVTGVWRVKLCERGRYSHCNS